MSTSHCLTLLHLKFPANDLVTFKIIIINVVDVEPNSFNKRSHEALAFVDNPTLVPDDDIGQKSLLLGSSSAEYRIGGIGVMQSSRRLIKFAIKIQEK